MLPGKHFDISCLGTYYNRLIRIIEPLASRCSKFRFTPLNSEAAMSRLVYIAEEEQVDVTKSVLQTLINVSNGDLRRAITYLQSASRLASASNPPAPILSSDIQEIAGVIPDKVINDFAIVLGIDVEDGAMDVDGNARKTDFSTIQKSVKMIVREGYAATQLLSQVNSCSQSRHNPRSISNHRFMT